MTRRKTEHLTHERLVDLLAYNPLTGRLTWRRNRSRLAKAGDEAGTINQKGVVMVGLDGRLYTAARLCWYHAHKEWPSHRLRFRNGNTNDLKLANLVTEDKLVREPSSGSLYQRQWRQDRREAERIIRADPALLRRYYAIGTDDPEGMRALMREVTDKVKDDRARFSRGRQAYYARR